MTAAYIVDALRTGGGRRNRVLRDWHPADMGAAVIDALVAKSGIDPAAVEDVIVGCVSQVGEQSFHVGRNGGNQRSFGCGKVLPHDDRLLDVRTFANPLHDLAVLVA